VELMPEPGAAEGVLDQTRLGRDLYGAGQGRGDRVELLGRGDLLDQALEELPGVAEGRLAVCLCHVAPPGAGWMLRVFAAWASAGCGAYPRLPARQTASGDARRSAYASAGALVAGWGSRSAWAA
jgi:hypothetical protein